MPAIIDITGEKYNRLTVLRRAENGCKQTSWVCLCDCGNETIVRTNGLRTGNTKSCGCIPRMNSDRILNDRGELVRPPGYWSWKCMQSRCRCKGDLSYEDYGGRGITICDRWLGRGGLANFLADMGEKPSEYHSIGRIDPDKNYCPENCRWETPLEQGVNKRTTKLLRYNGESHTVAGWERKLGLAVGGLHWRIRRGWSMEKALSTPRVGEARQVSDGTKPDGAKQKGDYSPEDEFTG